MATNLRHYGTNESGAGGQDGQHGEKSAGKVEVRFDPQSGTLLLGLGGKEQLGPGFIVEMEGRGFTPKDELHMTVIGFRQGGELKKVIAQKPSLAVQVAQLAESMDWDVQPTDEMYLLTKAYEGEAVPRQSIVQMAECPAVSSFMHRLNELAGTELYEQPPHVTLATRGNPKGIGINTAQDIATLGQRIA